jgi:hypothetical protein
MTLKLLDLSFSERRLRRVAPRGSIHRSFSETYCLHLQGHQQILYLLLTSCLLLSTNQRYPLSEWRMEGAYHNFYKPLRLGMEG